MRRLTGILAAQQAALSAGGARDPADVIRHELERVALMKVKSPKTAARVAANLEKQLVKLEPGLSEIVDRLMSTAYPAVAQVFDEELAPVIENALRYWPVRTGYSRDRLVAGLSMSNGNKRITMSFAALASYSLFVKWGRKSKVPRDIGTSSSVWVSLGRLPWALASQRTKLRMQTVLSAAVKDV